MQPPQRHRRSQGDGDQSKHQPINFFTVAHVFFVVHFPFFSSAAIINGSAGRMPSGGTLIFL